MLHFNCLVILLSSGFEALLHHEFILSNSTHLLANLNILSLLRCLVDLVSLVFDIDVSELVLVLSEFIDRGHLLVMVLVRSNSNITHLFVVLFKVIQRPVLVVYALTVSFHLLMSEVFVILLL
jgi:hypothetical protein